MSEYFDHFAGMRAAFHRAPTAHPSGTPSANFARVLVLDKWLCNSDGQAVCIHRPPRCRKYRATYIDHGYCFNAGEWTFPDSPFRGVYADNAAYASVTGWRSFEPALSRAQSMSLDEILQCASGMPEAWYEHDANHCIALSRRCIRGAISSAISSPSCGNPAAIPFPTGRIKSLVRSAMHSGLFYFPPTRPADESTWELEKQNLQIDQCDNEPPHK